MTKWIAITEQLPDDDQTVLIALDDGEVWTGYMDEGVWRYVSADLIDSAKVTHWAEFPEPPAPDKSYGYIFSKSESQAAIDKLRALDPLVKRGR